MTAMRRHHLGRSLRAEAGQVYELRDGTAAWLARIERRDATSVRSIGRADWSIKGICVSGYVVSCRSGNSIRLLGAGEATEFGCPQYVPLPPPE